jgi:signal transduction histidine kinase
MAVEDRLVRALAVLRGFLLLNAVVLSLIRADTVDRPMALAGCVAVMVLWTAFATWAYADRARRTPVLLGSDLAVAVALLLVTPYVTGDDGASVPGYWVIGALVAWAVHWRMPGGLVAGIALAAADLARQEIDPGDYGNAFLLLMGGTAVGYVVASLQEMATDRDAAQHEAAVASERARLALVVHDGVLQVLALVQRRGRELGGEAAELARLAGEQEEALRVLVSTQDREPAVAGQVDVAAELARLGSRPGVTVSTPGFPVPLTATAGRELVAAVAACLDNVDRHVGAGAPAWVLLESFPDRVEVSVRDEGSGIAPGRLEQAADEGRLGVTESIRGRITDLGGVATLHTGPDGTEWEMVVPRPDDPEVST